MNPPEFSRPVRLDTLGAAPRTEEIAASAEERAALARRFGLPSIEQLSASAALSRDGDAVRASGRLSARVTQSCVASGAPVATELDEPFGIEFRPTPADGKPDEEIELSEGELDVSFYEGAVVDFGEAVAETLSLALDPFPRSPEADVVLVEAGVVKEGEEVRTGPLAGLKDLLSNRKD